MIIMSGDNLTLKTQERPLHKIKANLPHWAEFEIMRSSAFYKLHVYYLAACALASSSSCCREASSLMRWASCM